MSIVEIFDKKYNKVSNDSDFQSFCGAIDPKDCLLKLQKQEVSVS